MIFEMNRIQNGNTKKEMMACGSIPGRKPAYERGKTITFT